MDHGGGQLIPGCFSPRVARGFTWLTRRMLRKSFNALRLERGSRPVLHALAAAPGPVILALSHASWWDPLVVVALRRDFFPGRRNMSPMDAVELRRFSILRRIGIFGLDPEAPESMGAFRAYVAAEWAAHPTSVLALTPQGRFADPREPVRLRPGAALVAAATPGVQAFALAIEYVFWADRAPELLTRVRRVTPRDGSRRAWSDAFLETMEENRLGLAALAAARDPGAFETLLGREAGGTHWAYDLWLRLTGRGRRIDASRRRDLQRDDRAERTA
ncbi:MAG: hypothetical protein U0574_05800 [Phycisphaerales bacterium]